MRVIGELGRGGFGVVHLVEYADGRVLARKTFAPSVPISAESTQGRLAEGRFRKEVRIQKSIAHPNVVGVIDEDLRAAPPWFTMPRASSTLQQEIAANRNKGAVTFDALWDVLAGLEALHTSGYVHRDLKPENVLRLETGWAVSDFGLARATLDDASVRTGQGGGLGTMGYMSPEQFGNFHAAWNSTDVFDLGCIVHDIFRADEANRVQLS